jgi:hypothetical protein
LELLRNTSRVVGINLFIVLYKLVVGNFTPNKT